MRATLLSFLAAGAALAMPALAQNTAPPAAFTVTGGATLTSDYRFRGISRTDRRVAIQGTIGVAHASGLYVGTWASSIDDYVADGANAEIDLYGGIRKTFSGTTIDAGLLYYHYAGAGGIDPDFFEPYANVAHSFGPVGVKAGANFAWKQRGLSYGAAARARGLYLYGEISTAIPTTGFTVTGHLGRSFERNYITFGNKVTDYGLTVAYSWRALTFSAAYVDTDKDFPSFPGGGGRNRDVAGSGFVGAVSATF